MKIARLDSCELVFDNGSRISSHWEQDCCERNYADFEYLKDDKVCMNTDFKEPLVFQKVDGYGFRFGNKPSKMFYVPCYSEQNGYYTSEVDIYYKGEIVLEGVEAELQLL